MLSGAQEQPHVLQEIYKMFRDPKKPRMTYEQPDKPMTLADYITATGATARYPAPIDGVPIYAALGLAGEAQEVMDAMMADDATNVKEELGDVLWYAARMFVDSGLTLPTLKLSEIESPVGLSDESVGATALMVLAGQCCEIVKRWYQRGSRLETEITQLRDNLMILLAAIAACADFYGVSLQAVALDNVSKLKVRFQN